MIRLTWGSSRDWAQLDPACRAVRAAAARPTSSRLGSAARTLSGVGPAWNSALSTPVVASRPKAVKTPPSVLSVTVATVSRGLASHAMPSACRISRGSRRATVRKPSPAIVP